VPDLISLMTDVWPGCFLAKQWQSLMHSQDTKQFLKI